LPAGNWRLRPILTAAELNGHAIWQLERTWKMPSGSQTSVVIRGASSRREIVLERAMKETELDDATSQSDVSTTVRGVLLEGTPAQGSAVP
jgi:hypothetical protein